MAHKIYSFEFDSRSGDYFFTPLIMSNQTNTDIKLFKNENFGEVRVTKINGEPLFCLSDVCGMLELSAKDVKRRLSGEVVTNHPIIDNLGRTQKALFVNEDGLYDVILDSRKPEAKEFRRWVTSEILPTLRKTGSYSTSAPGAKLVKGYKSEIAKLKENCEILQENNKLAISSMHLIKESYNLISEENERLRSFKNKVIEFFNSIKY